MIEMLLCTSDANNADTIRWGSVPLESPGPRGVYAMGFASVGDDIYSYGGKTTVEPTLTDVPFWKYNTVTKVYTPLLKPNISWAMDDVGLAYSSGILVTIGGRPQNRSIRYYNIGLGVWSNITLNYPVSASSIALVTCGVRVYGVGGLSNNLPINTVCYIDCTTLAIVPVADLPINARGGAAFTLSNSDEFYYYGGYTTVGVSSRLFKYTISTNTWVELPSGPIGDTNLRAAVVDGIAYISGFSEANYNSCVLKYDGTHWEILKPAIPAPPNRRLHGIAAAGGSVYIFGGYNGTTLADMWRYTPPV